MSRKVHVRRFIHQRLCPPAPLGRLNHLIFMEKFGGCSRIRTYDPLIKRSIRKIVVCTIECEIALLLH
jgi:hypothetical protein